MNKLRVILISFLFLGLCFFLIQCETNNSKNHKFLTGKGIGINNVTLMVKNIDSAINYYKDTLGFVIRTAPKKGVFPGTKTSAMYLGDFSSFEFLSIADSVDEGDVTPFIKSFLNSYQGIRFFSVHTSSIDSTLISLSERGFKMDTIHQYQSRLSQPEGWSRDNPKQKSLDFNATNPPMYLPRFIEKTGGSYKDVRREWKTYYVNRRMNNTAPNGVVGIKAVRILVDNVNSSSSKFQEMGFDLIAQTDSIARFQLYKNHEIHVMAAKNQEQRDFLAKRGEGVFVIRFDVVNIDSTMQYFEKVLPSEALNKSSDLLTIAADYAFGVQLEFTQEPEEQNILARTYTPSEELDSLALVHSASLYTKYCALCHGDNREGYAADNAPSLRSKSLLGTSMHSNFMRYTVQYGRANTAMAGYLDAQGGPLEDIEVELILKWLNEMADVKEPIELSREPVVGDIEIGANIYNLQCASCHGRNGEGISAPALGNPMTLATATDHFLRYAIAEGRDGTPMKAYKDQLSNKEIDDLVAFLRTRSSGWDIPKPIPVKIPSPEEYILNPHGDNPVFSLKEDKYVSSVQVNEALKNGQRMIILDARSEVAWRQMHIPGAIPVPYYEEPENFINDIPNDGTQIVVYCACPHAASGRVLSTLRRNGFKNTAIIDEGILVWAQLGFPVRSGN